MFYNLYYTLNINIPKETLSEEKKAYIVKLISDETNILKSQMYLLLIIEHACNEEIISRDDILKGILPFGIKVLEDEKIFIDEKELPNKLFYILEKAMSL